MKNSHLKNSLIAAGIAVFAGVVTLGANVAFGVTNPAQQPVDATLVSPTFGGLDVRGDIKNGDSDINGGAVNFEGDVITNGLIKVGNGIKSRYDIGVAIKDDLNVLGLNAADGNKVRIRGDLNSISSDSGTLVIGSLLDAQYGIKNTTLNNAGDVFINDDIEVTGDAKVRSLEVTLNGIDVPTGAVTAEQFIANGGVEGAFMKTTGAITAGALILSPDNNMGIESSGAGGVKINDPLDAWETIINTNKNNVGAEMPVKIADNLDVIGEVKASQDLSLGNFVKDQRFLFHSRTNGGGDFLQITNDKADGSWDWNNGIIMKRGSAENSPSTQLHVNGKITSTNGFGTYSKVVGTPSVNIAAGASGEGSATCGSLQLISCQNIDFNINHLLMGIRSDSNTCYVSAKNISTNQTMKVTAVAICLNPKL